MATMGIHLIWTSYGTWLPGDERGHWSPLFDFYGNLIECGGKLNRTDLVTRKVALERMKEQAKILKDDELAVVAQTIGTLVRRPDRNSENPGLPSVYAAAIETMHVHLLLGPVRESIGTVAGRLKGRTSSDVLALPHNQGRERTWTAKYWKVFVFDAMALAAVKEYIENHNVRRGLAPAPFPWISPVDI
jgi:REP element-mobilizing transposase RayT